MSTELQVWDAPFFKILKKNETGQGKSNQSGFVVNVSIQKYMPLIFGVPTAAMPTVSTALMAELRLEGNLVEVVTTRYQIQSWKGARRENRVTGNLRPLLKNAKAGDLLIMRRRVDAVDNYCFDLVPAASKNFSVYTNLIGDRGLGALDENNSPESFANELSVAAQEQEERAEVNFSLFDPDRRRELTVLQKSVRSYAFSKRTLNAYEGKCAVCKGGLKSPYGALEVEGAHVVPHAISGADDVRNGIALCRAHHWAFDKGLFCVTSKRELHVPEFVKEFSENSELSSRHGQKIFEPSEKKLRVHKHAFAWHKKNTLLRKNSVNKI